MVAPFGFLVYHLAKFTFLQKYKSHNRIDFHDEQNLSTKSNMNQLQTEVLKHRPVRFGDQFPEPLRKVYHFIVGIIGVIVLFTIALPAYIGLRIYCRIIYRSSSNQLTTNSQLTPDKFVPEYVRNVTSEMKLTSLTTSYDKRNFIWYLKFLLLQFSTFIEYISNAKNPIALFNALNDYFNQKYNINYFVFGDGIGVNSYELVKRYLQDISPHKDLESLGWQVSSSQATFSDLTTIFLSSDNPQMKLSRDIIFEWLHSFPYNLHDNNTEARFYLSRLVPRKIDQKPDDKIVYQAVGEVIFFLATGGELRKHEREAFIDCVTNSFIFLPNWFNFLLAGHYFERKTLNSYYVLLQAFSRYSDGPALRAAFKVAENQKSPSEVLKLIAIAFSIAGSAAPAKLAFAVIERLWTDVDKAKNIFLFKKNPHNYIKECARLDKVVPMVNVIATKTIANEIEENFRNNNLNINIPENTPIHCSLVNANIDEKIFLNPEKFLPERSELNKIFVWNGVEEDILNTDKNKRPIRYCPGHDLSLDVIQYVVEQFLPIISDDNDNYEQEKIINEETLLNSNSKRSDEPNSSIKEDDNKKSSSSDDSEKKLVLMNFNINQSVGKDYYCYKILDNYTKIVMLLMDTAVHESNSIPARGSDILQPLNLPAKDLGIIRLNMGKFIPSWDEDEPKGSNLKRRIARWLVNQNIWDFDDCLIEFNSLEQAIQWRQEKFSAVPIPNIVYQDMLSDEAMTQLAFSGCACHYTHRIEKTWQPGHGIPDEKFLEDAVYVNDVTCLSTFCVRKPFEHYGAAAYFDKNFQVIAIYWSHASRLIKRGEQFWNHAKYVWRSSFFANVTICDHLVVTHMIECNAFVNASRKYLPINHPLRIFIKPFTYHTISINYQAAMSLINERGLVHRIWAFDYDEFLKVCDYISMNYKFRLLPKFISDTMNPKENNKTDDEWDKIYPIYHDLNAFWKIIRKYVTDFFHINYGVTIEKDDLPNDIYIIDFINEICKQLGITGITSLKHFIDVLSQLIASSTGVHEHVGQVSGYLIDPRFVGAKLQEGKEIQNIQTYTQILVLSVVTGLRMPGLLEDWSHIIEHDEYYRENLKNYRSFKRELRELSRKIDSLNKTRNYPFESFNPKYMECSTSV
jgi:hypothetical protein